MPSGNPFFTSGEKPWSASRISTYRQCPLKYYYTYVKKWVCSKPADTTAADKGTCFHETVEHFHTGMAHDELYKILEEKIVEYDVDTTQYDEKAALERFFLFWNECVAKKELVGYQVKQESWASGEMGGEKFCGALDLFLDRGDKCCIYDYKSGKTPSIAKYKDQLMLYAYLIGQSKGWNMEETAENIKLYLFFPLSEQTKPITEKDKMLASVKEVKYDANVLRDCINGYLETIREIQAHNWDEENLDSLGCPAFPCNWCEHKGGNPNDEGYKGCKATRDQGFRQERFVTYHLKENKK